MRAKEGTALMLELGFQEQNRLRSGFRAREISPNSVISTVDPSFSLFSSASGSVDRCSFASDVHDHDSLASEVSQHLAGHDLHETSSGPDSDPNKSTVRRWNSRVSRKVEKAKVPKDDNYAEIVDSVETLDSARSSFSQALRECKDQRSRSEALLRRADKRRQASLDLNNPTSNTTTNFSPRLGVMKKTSVLNRSNGSFPSPGTPNYRHASVGVQKGWSSERVPLPTSGNRRQAGAALLPLNNGRTLPSKWEDAERWIFSPVGDGSARQSSQQPQRRPKAKSGPLGPPGVAYYSMYSPAVTMFDGGNIGSLMAGSPFSAGVIAADRMSLRSSMDSGAVGIYPANVEPCMARSVSVHGCSEMRSQLSLPAPQEKCDSDAATNISRVVSRRDMATQMSPEGSPYSSPERRLSFSPSSPSALPIVEVESFRSSKPEVRDVQVDGRVTMTRWSKKHKARFPGKSSEIVDDWKMEAVEGESCAWQVSEVGKGISRVKREEAKISAWENLQQAKAEAAIRKLEMKLEKKRSSSMNRIIKKLRSAQKKAQEMRSSVLANQSHEAASTSGKLVSFRRPRQISSLSGCFMCHAS